MSLPDQTQNRMLRGVGKSLQSSRFGPGAFQLLLDAVNNPLAISGDKALAARNRPQDIYRRTPSNLSVYTSYRHNPKTTIRRSGKGVRNLEAADSGFVPRDLGFLIGYRGPVADFTQRTLPLIMLHRQVPAVCKTVESTSLPHFQQLTP